jgi:hypothetical protein
MTYPASQSLTIPTYNNSKSAFTGTKRLQSKEPRGIGVIRTTVEAQKNPVGDSKVSGLDGCMVLDYTGISPLQYFVPSAADALLAKAAAVALLEEAAAKVHVRLGLRSLGRRASASPPPRLGAEPVELTGCCVTTPSRGMASMGACC